MKPAEASGTQTSALVPVITPHGRLLVAHDDEASALVADLAHGLINAFTRGSGHGLLQLGAAEVSTALPPVFSYWRDLGARYVTAVCTRPDLEEHRARAHVPAPPPEELEALAAAAPPMQGAEYLTASVLEALWSELDDAFRLELAESGLTIQDFLKQRNPAWNLVGRVHFNLAENRKDDEGAVRLSRDLYDAAVGARQGAAPAARPGAARIRRREEPRAAALSAAAGAARGRAMRLAEGDGRCRRDLSSAALVARRSVPAPHRYTAPRSRRRRRARAGRLESRPSAASAGQRHRRRQAAFGSRPRRAARFQHGGDARRRASHRRRDQRSCSPDPKASRSSAGAGWR